MSFKIRLEMPIDPNAKLLLPISLFQKYHRGSFLKAYLEFSKPFNSTFLIADALQRYNLDNNLDSALSYGAKFLKKNKFLTNSSIIINNIDEWLLLKEEKVIKIIHWDVWKKIKATEFAVAVELIRKRVQQEKILADAMKEVTETFIEKCPNHENSLNYQIEECAFLLTFQEFDYHIYPTFFNRSQEVTYEIFKEVLKIPIPLIPIFHEVKKIEVVNNKLDIKAWCFNAKHLIPDVENYCYEK